MKKSPAQIETAESASEWEEGEITEVGQQVGFHILRLIVQALLRGNLKVEKGSQLKMEIHSNQICGVAGGHAVHNHCCLFSHSWQRKRYEPCNMDHRRGSLQRPRT